ncbi:MAG TPA: quinoprotein dehydrogenase-associated putative ABC transporter substrate-binding protein [Pseudomonadales bacterium]
MYPLGKHSIWLILGVLLMQPAAAQDRDAFRVCADPNNLPFSHRNLQGFENRLAQLWAARLGQKVEYTWFPQRIGFVRNTLNAKNERNEYRCDVVMGVAAGYDQLETTKPYYRSTYALVYVKGRGLDDVDTGAEFVDLAPERKAKLRVGAFDSTPGPAWLQRHGMLEQMVAYPAMSGNPADYPGEILEQALTEGQIDAAIIWGPIAGYFANRAEKVEMVVIPLESEPGIQFDFAVSAGVRRGDDETKAEVEQLMEQTAGEIRTLLERYNVPLLETAGGAWESSGDD